MEGQGDALKTLFSEKMPEAFFLDLADAQGLEAHLRQCGLLNGSQQLVKVEKAGQGNMNLTLRAVYAGGSLIVKQSRPWVEKHPHIEAPASRACTEALFYQTVEAHQPVAGKMPAFLGLDPGSNLLFLEDLGSVPNMETLYQGGMLEDATAGLMVDWLAALHGIPLAPDTENAFENKAMRRLNHAHVFDIPLQKNNGLPLDDITPGLKKAAEVLKNDLSVCRRINDIGQLYLHAAGGSLLHGDFYPGSWLKTGNGLFVIDPEFCFAGPPEWDLGVFMAHTVLARQHPAMQSFLLDRYRSHHKPDLRLAYNFAGTEIFRRLAGLAQLPVVNDIDVKTDMLGLAFEWILM